MAGRVANVEMKRDSRMAGFTTTDGLMFPKVSAPGIR